MTEPVLALLLEQQSQVDRAVADVRDRERQLTALLGDLSELGSGRRHGPVETLHGVEAVRDWLARTQDDITRESLVCVPGGGQPQASLDAALPLDRALLERGIALRTLYQTSAANDPVTRRHVTTMTALGERVRTVPRVPMRMLVTDRRVALVPIDPSDSSLGAVVVRTPGIVGAFLSLFESYWAVGVPFGAAHGPSGGPPQGFATAVGPAAGPTGGPSDGPGLSAHERSVLEALAAGLRDEQIAEELAVSVRTVRRTVAVLMERLGAVNRFGAGVAAVRSGWLPPDD